MNQIKEHLHKYNQLLQNDKSIIIDADILNRHLQNYLSNELDTNNHVIKKRPRGRKPKGKVWNEVTGEWDDESKELIINTTKLSELKKKAIQNGITESKLLEIDDSDNPKELLINYLNKLTKETTDNNNVNISELKNVDINNEEELDNDSLIYFENIEYLWDSTTNELTDQNTYDIIGIWKNGSINFNDGMEELHNQNKL